MSCIDLYDKAEIIAVGSADQKIKFYNFKGNVLNSIRFHDGFLGQRMGPISCVNFNQYKPLLAVGATDSYVSIFASQLGPR